MKKMLLSILLLSLIAGCNSKTESKGINDVVEFYGGTISYTKGFNASTGNDAENGKFAEIRLNSPAIAQNFSSPDLPASNCAYLFYHALTSGEKKDYSFIRVIIQENNRETKYVYPIDELDKVERAFPTLLRSVQYIKEGNVEKFRSLLNPLLSENAPKMDTLRHEMMALDSAYGKVKDHWPLGFSFSHVDTAGKTIRLVRLTATLVREKQNRAFRLSIDPDAKEQNIYGYGFVE